MKGFRCRASESSCNQGEVLLLLLALMLLVIAPDLVQAKRGFDFEGREEQSRKLSQRSVFFGVDQWVNEGCVDCPAGDPNCEGCIKRRRRIAGTQQNALQEEEEEELHTKKRTKKRDIRLAVILGSFSALIALLVCGPLCCICYGAKRIREVRSKAAATHSLMFAEQWRAYNLFMPFNEEELGQHTLEWSAWQFVFRSIPEELNGLSTAIFQSIPPVSGCLRSYSGQPLQQIRLNPSCARVRRSQSLQCLLPLASSVHPPNCLPNVSYFEMTILSFCRNGKNGRSSGSIGGGRVAIGLAARPAPPFRLPGLDLVSLGYHSNGSVYINDPHDGEVVSRRWNYVGVTVGCGYDLEQGVVFFTLNGGPEIRTDFAFRADGPIPSTIPHLFPVVGADCDITVVVNLGQTEFVFPAANARRCEPFGGEQQQMFMQGRRMEEQEQQQHPLLLQQQEMQEQQMQETGQEGGGGSRSSLDQQQQQQCCRRGSIDDHESEVYFSASEEPSPPV